MLAKAGFWMFNFFLIFLPSNHEEHLYETSKPFIMTSLGLMVRSRIRLNVVGKRKVDILTVPLTC